MPAVPKGGVTSQHTVPAGSYCLGLTTGTEDSPLSASASARRQRTFSCAATLAAPAAATALWLADASAVAAALLGRPLVRAPHRDNPNVDRPRSPPLAPGLQRNRDRPGPGSLYLSCGGGCQMPHCPRPPSPGGSSCQLQE